MVLNYLGHNTTQTTLASNTYLRTEANGGTNYGDNVMAPTLDELAGLGNFYGQQNAVGLSTYESDFTWDIDDGYPVVIAAYENSSYYLVPAEVGWYHWYVVDGYTVSGVNSMYVDPASGIWSVPAYGTVSSSTVYGTMSNGGFGYVW